MKTKFIYGKRIRASLETFINNFNDPELPKGIKEKEELRKTIYKVIKNYIGLSDKQIQEQFIGNEKNQILLRSIWAINKGYKNQIRAKKLDAISKQSR